MRRKRSSALKLTTMLAGAASVSLAGCAGEPEGAATGTWNEAAVAGSEPVPADGYLTLSDCERDGVYPAEICRESYDAALADDQSHAPRYDARGACEAVHGPNACAPRITDQGQVFVPLLAGFVIARMLDGRGHPYYRGTSLYREREEEGGGGGGGGAYVTAWGGRPLRHYTTGQVVIPRAGVEPPAAMRAAPPRVRTRAMVESRGGFGKRAWSRGYGG